MHVYESGMAGGRPLQRDACRLLFWLALSGSDRCSVVLSKLSSGKWLPEAGASDGQRSACSRREGTARRSCFLCQRPPPSARTARCGASCCLADGEVAPRARVAAWLDFFLDEGGSRPVLDSGGWTDRGATAARPWAGGAGGRRSHRQQLACLSLQQAAAAATTPSRRRRERRTSRHGHRQLPTTLPSPQVLAFLAGGSPFDPPAAPSSSSPSSSSSSSMSCARRTAAATPFNASDAFGRNRLT